MFESEITSLANTDKEYKLDFGQVLNKAIQLTTDNLATIWIINLIYFFMAIILTLTIVGIIALPALKFGYTIITKKLLDGEAIEIGDLFKGFDYFVPTFKVFLGYMGFVFLIISPFLLLLIPIIGSGGDEEVIESMAPIFGMFYLLFIFLTSVGVYIFNAFFGLAPQFKVFGNLSTVNAFKSNYRFGKKRFILWVALFLIGGLIGGIATYLFLLGLHFMEFMKNIAFFEIMKQQQSEEESLITQFDNVL